MSEKVVTTADLIVEVRKIAEAEPDYVYGDEDDRSGCSYFTDRFGTTKGNPCIVGKALRNLEVDTSILRRREAYSHSDRIAFALVEGFVPVVSTVIVERDWLNSVQDYQDVGLSWSEAVKNADRMVGKICASESHG